MNASIRSGPLIAICVWHQPTHDLLAMLLPSRGSRLISAVQQANQSNSRVIIPGGRTEQDGRSASFNIDIQPVQSDGEELMLILLCRDN